MTEHERDAAILGCLGDELGERELATLSDRLRSDASARAAAIDLARLAAALTIHADALLPRPRDTAHAADPTHHATPIPTATKLRLPRPIYALAAALLLAACAFAIVTLAMSNRQSPIDNPQSPPPPLASVTDVLDGTLLIDDQLAAAGNDYAGRSVSLDAGEAEIMLPRGVTARLRGMTRLKLHDAMNVTMSSGTAEFDCPPGAKGYTVHLPSGIRVVDLGTRFTVATTDNLSGFVAVAAGSVEAHSASDPPLVLTADQAVVALVDPATEVVRFHRVDPMLRHDAAISTRARNDGPFTVGSLIEIGQSPRRLTHLGVQDAGPNGPADDGFRGEAPVRVGLWDESGRRLLASVEVRGDDPRIGGWRYAGIGGDPVRLEARTRYRIGAYVGGDIEWFLASLEPSAFSIGSGLRVIDSCHHSGAFAAPMTLDGRAFVRWGAANALTLPIESRTDADASGLPTDPIRSNRDPGSQPFNGDDQ